MPEEAKGDNEEKNEEEKNENEDPPKWEKSAARDYLYGLLLDGKIPGKDDIKPKQVFETYLKHRPEFRHFQDYTALKFAAKLGYLRDKAKERGGRAADDAARFARDRTIFPAPTVDTKGNAMWQKSKAQELLREDVKDRKHKDMKPKQLYEKREEYYKNYSLDFFRERIYQEAKWHKRQEYLKDKAEAAATKKK